MPTEAMAQTQGCTFSGGTCTFPTGSYSTPLLQEGTNGSYYEVDVNAGTTATVDPTGSIFLYNSSAIFKNNAPAGTQSAPAGTVAAGLQVVNNGSLILQTAGSPWPANTTVTGLYSSVVGGDGYSGSNPGNAGFATAPLNVNNNGTITISLPYADVMNGAALYALAAGGHGGCNSECFNSYDSTVGGNGGSSAGLTVTNTGTINVAVGTQGGGGQNGFAGIAALSIGGNAGRGDNAATGGGSGFATVTNSAPVTVNFGWSADPAGSSSGVYGIQALSQGGNGTGAKGNYSIAGSGGGVDSASVTLTSGGTVAVTATGTPPQAGIGSGLLATIMGAGAAAEAIGGNGGNGEEEDSNAGSGGNTKYAPTITVTDADVTASGPGLAGLLALSQGGNGGLGATENDGSNSGSAYSSGGAGGTAAGPSVNVAAQTQNVTISTNESNSPAIAAFALGGVGGLVNPNKNNDGHNTDTFGGGGGNVAGATSITLTGTNGYFVDLTTNGGTSPGLYVVSQGGYGGYGGDFDPSLSHGYGGNGGNGGSGDDVTVTLQSASITTQGSASQGIIAQSQGGVGGGGGIAEGGAGTSTGGAGGAGGNTGNVAVSLDRASSIITFGTDSSGVMAQALSGGGGVGGDESGHQGQGGNGGGGGNAGNVTVTNDGVILTSGNNSRGILAQSLAGAGASGGNAGGFFNNNGGTGGSSGTAGTVLVTNFGTIATSGSNAQGIVAQSIGGGGGAGGWASGYGAVGGSGAFAADGDLAGVNYYGGSITTSGLSAAGVLVQSIGGGGGDGGGASGGVVTVGGSSGGGGDGANAEFCSGGVCGGGSVQITTRGDYSPAVLLQSIGGGGGNAGNASSFTPFGSIAIGGNGGGGGGGGTVNLTTSQTNITTVGTKSPGLVAQSIGGGGGTGGNAFASAVGVGVAVAVGAGGNAGGGGDGGSVFAGVQQETIATGQSPQLLNGNLCMSPPCNTTPLPVDSYGVVVQSIGGGGGLGGSATAQAVALAVPLPDPDGGTTEIGVAIGAAVGGAGGAGGNGGTAQFQLSNGGMIKTSGQGSTGVLLQSIGGGGGAGGDSSSMATVIGTAAPIPEGTTSINIAVTYSLGGTAGGGGNGGIVNAALGGTVLSDGTFSADPSGSAPTAIVTYGDFANGVTAQSIGGGGGNAGYGSGNTQAFGAGNDITVNVALGGKGGPGGTGGPVNVELYPGNGITTYGSGGVGILAQSIGGGGGASQGDSFAFAAPLQLDKAFIVGATLNLGVQGGTGGNSSPVFVGLDAPITTHGGDATGVLAQSIGGGGGLAGSAGADASADSPVDTVGNARQAGSNLAAAKSGDTPIQATYTQTIGGVGGTGGNGSTVTANLNAAITTAGDWANGVVAQSIGGGGGKGGSAAATGTGGIPAITVNADVAIGGNGGSGGAGDQVSINLGEGSSIGTAGFGATGLIGQSIGGGGGIGADGSDAAAGTLSVGLAFGGKGGQGGSGGPVTLAYVDSTIVTTGAAADGVELQSIAGGGGIAGAGSSLFFSSADKWLQPGALALAAGGGSASSGYGGTVTFAPQQGVDTPLLSILTTGNDAFGILAQSISGGGGVVTSQPVGSTTGTPVTLALGGNTSSSGNAGTVNVTLPGGSNIQTTGVASHGVVAQSIGGGGGVLRLVNAAGDTPGLTTSMGGLTSYQTNGNGGTVNVQAGGQILVSGAGAVGILAQSVGGGGGLVMNGGSIQAGTSGLSGSSGSGGAVTVTSTGSVFATGQNGIGIFAQSTGPSTSSNGQVAVTVSGGVVGGSGSGATSTSTGSAGIVVDSPSGANGGNGNQVTVNAGGLVTTLSDTAGTAILASGGGFANLTNDGIITGSVLLNGVTGGSALLNNGLLTNHGTLNAGATVAADVVNSGTVNVGRPGTHAPQTTTITGDFTQTGEGRLGVTVDSLNKTAGHLQVDGTATLDGRIVPTAITLLPGSVPVVTAGHLVSTVEAADVQLFHWDVAQSGNTLSLSPRSDFKPNGVALTDSQSSLAGYYGRAWDNGDKAFATRFAELSQIADRSDYKAALDAWSSKAAHAQSIALANSVSTILGAAMSCPIFVDQNVLLGEDNCVWSKVTGRWTDQSSTGNSTQGYHVSGTTYRIGAQHEIAPDWYLGASFGFGQSWTTIDGGSSGNGDTYDGSVTVKRVMGPWQFAGSMAFAGGSFESYRRVDIPGIADETLKSDPSIFLAGGRLRAAYEFAFDDWYIRPYGDLDVVYSELPGFQEKGDDLYALDVHDSSKTSVALSPMVEFGGRLDVDPETTLRAYAAFGVSYQPDNTRTIHSSFVGVSSANGTFSDQIDSPEVLGRIDVGVQLFRAGGFELKGEYTADVGDSFLSQSASARFAYHF
ncbi:hypothetical protein [Mesorhizobium sp. LjRoot246]|uniref:hypothetical protein n=1 Tax=Mesorhizobium sp. LjRoot246 TaxID=3342294 RepID=UPI003F4F4D5E